MNEEMAAQLGEPLPQPEGSPAQQEFTVSYRIDRGDRGVVTIVRKVHAESKTKILRRILDVLNDGSHFALKGYDADNNEAALIVPVRSVIEVDVRPTA